MMQIHLDLYIRYEVDDSLTHEHDNAFVFFIMMTTDLDI